MTIFKKADNEPAKPRERLPLNGRNAGLVDGKMSIIGPGMAVVGDLVTEGTVRIEGEVRGTIRAAKAVIVGPDGHVEGNIETQDAVIGGQVHGAIVATNRLELQSTCQMTGEVRTRPEGLKLDEGARFTGQVQMLEEERDRVPALEPSTSGKASLARRVHDEAIRPVTPVYEENDGEATFAEAVGSSTR